jgi:hypothetical protein
LGKRRKKSLTLGLLSETNTEVHPFYVTTSKKNSHPFKGPKTNHPLLKLIYLVSMSKRKSSIEEVHLCHRKNHPLQKFIPFASLSSNRKIIRRMEK